MSINNYEIDWDFLGEEVFKLVKKEREHLDYYIERENPDSLIRIEIKRLKDHLMNGTLSWFVARVSERVLIELAASWIVTRFKDRKLLSQLDYKGMRYDYTYLIKGNMSAEFCAKSEDTRKILEEIYDFCDEKDEIWNPKAHSNEVFDKIRKYKDVDCLKLIEEIRSFNQNVFLDKLYEEKIFARWCGVELIDCKRITQYIVVTECILAELLSKIIILNRFIEQSVILEEIYLYVKYNKNLIQDYVSLICKEVPYQEIIIDESGKVWSDADQRFSLLEQYGAYIEETRKIERSLVLDIDKNEADFNNIKPFKHLLVQEYKNKKEIVIDLNERMNVCTDDYIRFENAQKYITFCNEKGEELGDEKNMILLRIVYRELFKNKAKVSTKDKTAGYLVKKQMDGKEIEKREEIFLESKIRRGWFRECGKISEYKIYTKILQEYRDIMLFIISLPIDIMCYKTTGDVFDAVLEIIGTVYEELARL